ncbi:hypothetical protein [Acinetobacter baumannii]|uniref:hypothetical protein n=1 Tax=Acinetobacter baumannii TaxID=470 RepID=UPI00367102EC
MKKLQLLVDIAESSANISDMEDDVGFKFPESTSLPKVEVVSLEKRFLEHWSDTYSPIHLRYEL